MNFFNGIEYENRIISINLDNVESVDWSVAQVIDEKGSYIHFNSQYNENNEETSYTYYTDSFPTNAIVYLQGSRNYFNISESSLLFSLYEKVFNKTITPQTWTKPENNSGNTGGNQQMPGTNFDAQL